MMGGHRDIDPCSLAKICTDILYVFPVNRTAAPWAVGRLIGSKWPGKLEGGPSADTAIWGPNMENEWKGSSGVGRKTPLNHVLAHT